MFFVVHERYGWRDWSSDMHVARGERFFFFFFFQLGYESTTYAVVHLVSFLGWSTIIEEESFSTRLS